MQERATEAIVGLDPSGLRARYNEIFGTPGIFLRELLQNSVQAIRGKPVGSGVIDIRVNGGVLEVQDDGVGMEYRQAQKALGRYFGSAWNHQEGTDSNEPTNILNEFRELLSNITSSSHDSGDLPVDMEALLTGLEPADNEAIGRFGMGITTCLMVADSFRVFTRPQDGSMASTHEVRVAIVDENPTLVYTHDVAESLPFDGPGTLVRLTPGIRIQDGEGHTHRFDEYVDPSQLRKLALRYMQIVEVPIRLQGELISGGRADEDAVPSSFFSEVPGSEADDAAWVSFARRGSRGYLRARLAITSPAASETRLRVYSRGVFVGDMPSSEIVGDQLSFLQGAVDSDLFDLQLDRNRVQDNRRLAHFRDRIGIWWCEEIAKWCDTNWRTYADAVNANRSSILRYLYSDPEATHALGAKIPFLDAGQSQQWLPLSYFLDRPITTDPQTQVVAFTSGFTKGHPGIALTSTKGHPVAEFDFYIPMQGGRSNLDLLFVQDYLNMSDQQFRLSRVDSLLGQIAANSFAAASTRDLDVVLNSLRAHFDTVCDIHYAALGSKDTAGVVGTSFDQVRSEELPNPEEGESGGIEQMLESLLQQEGERKFGDRLKKVREKAKRPTLVLNLDHELVRRFTIQSDPSVLLAARLLVATLLLGSVREPDPVVLSDAHQNILELIMTTSKG